MPEWMDRRLRSYGVDASRLFQDAALAKINEADNGPGGPRKVTDWRDLTDICAPGVLDEYLEHTLMGMLKEKKKGE